MDSLCLYQKGYQQALEDFAIPNLLTRLKTYSDADFDAAWMNLTQPELESLATILIRQLTANVKGKAIPYGTASLHSSLTTHNPYAICLSPKLPYQQIQIPSELLLLLLAQQVQPIQLQELLELAYNSVLPCTSACSFLAIAQCFSLHNLH